LGTDAHGAKEPRSYWITRAFENAQPLGPAGSR
jgi:hypothetical protein